MMDDNIERNMGAQPIGQIMNALALKARDLIKASDEQITLKMVSRAVKGRRLNPHVQRKVLNALNAVAGKEYKLEDLFNY